MSEMQSAPYRILVSVGDDETSDPGFAEAAELMRNHPNVELHAVHALAQDLPGHTTLGFTLLDEKLKAAPTKLQQRLRRIAAGTGLHGRIIGHIGVGDPAAVVLQTATDIEADVIIVGTRHRKGLERLFLGSVADRIVLDAHCPVLVVTHKNYQGLKRTRRPDPPCAACLKVRAESQGQRYWCETHARPHIATHVIESTEHGSATDPTGMRIV